MFIARYGIRTNLDSYEQLDLLELEARAGLYTHLDGPHSRVKVGEFKIGKIAASREPHLTNTVADDPNVSDPEWAEKEGMSAFAGYPLLVDNRMVGVLAMFSRNPVSESVLTELEPLADAIAQFIHRKKVEENLTVSESRFRAAVGAVTSLIWTNTANGEMVGLQPGWSGFTGQTLEEYAARLSTPFIPDDHQPNRRVERRRSWKNGLSSRTSRRRIDGDGAFSRKRPVLNAAGKSRVCGGTPTSRRIGAENHCGKAKLASAMG